MHFQKDDQPNKFCSRFQLALFNPSSGLWWSIDDDGLAIPEFSNPVDQVQMQPTIHSNEAFTPSLQDRK